MLIDPYVTEKLRELDADLARRAPALRRKVAPAFALSPAGSRGRTGPFAGWARVWSRGRPPPTVPESDGARLRCRKTDSGV